MALSSSNAVRQLSDGNSQGTVLGQSSSDIIGFYGNTPVAQQPGATSNVTINASTITLTINTASSAGFGASTAVLYNVLVSTVAFLQTDIVRMQTSVNDMRNALSSSGVGIFSG